MCDSIAFLTANQKQRLTLRIVRGAVPLRGAGCLLLREHQPRDQRRRLLLHRRGRVRVGVERDRDGGVPEALADDLGMDTGLQGERGVGVAQELRIALLFTDPPPATLNTPERRQKRGSRSHDRAYRVESQEG
jgi:hypothetical protein